MSAIRTNLGQERACWDDTVTVEARDDEIVFSFQLSKTNE